MNITAARQQIADALIGTMGRHIAEEQAKEWARAVTVNKRKIKRCLEEKSGPQAKEEIGSLMRKTLGEHIPTEMAQDWGRAVFKNKKKILEVFKNLENKDEKMSEETNEDIEEIKERSGMLSEMSNVDFSKDPDSVASEVIRNARKQKMKEDEITTELDNLLKKKDIKNAKKKKIKSAVKKQLGIEGKAYAKETQPNQEGYTGKSRQNKMYKKKDTKSSKGKRDQPKQSGYSGPDKKEKMYAKKKEVSEDILDKVNASDDDKKQKMKLVEVKGHKEEFDFHCKYCAEGFNEEDSLRKHQVMCGS